MGERGNAIKTFLWGVLKISTVIVITISILAAIVYVIYSYKEYQKGELAILKDWEKKQSTGFIPMRDVEMTFHTKWKNELLSYKLSITDKELFNIDELSKIDKFYIKLMDKDEFLLAEFEFQPNTMMSIIDKDEKIRTVIKNGTMPLSEDIYRNATIWKIGRINK